MIVHKSLQYPTTVYNIASRQGALTGRLAVVLDFMSKAGRFELGSKCLPRSHYKSQLVGTKYSSILSSLITLF